MKSKLTVLQENLLQLETKDRNFADQKDCLQPLLTGLTQTVPLTTFIVSQQGCESQTASAPPLTQLTDSGKMIYRDAKSDLAIESDSMRVGGLESREAHNLT